eukprot:4227641-Ditylum_brightwellii.AAC.1
MTSSKTDILRKRKHRVSETSAKCRDTYCIVTRYVLCNGRVHCTAQAIARASAVYSPALHCRQTQ